MYNLLLLSSLLLSLSFIISNVKKHYNLIIINDKVIVRTFIFLNKGRALLFHPLQVTILIALFRDLFNLRRYEG